MRHGARQKGGLYRSRSGKILGVCKGLAEYFDFSVWGMRAIAVALLLLSGVWPMIILYFVAALLMKPEPILPLETEEEQEFYNSYASSRRMALHRLKRTYDNLDRRIQRIESIVTSREYDWERRFNEETR
ncbi:MAG TPA: envelope stress response membrane protein PspC [Methylomirabilota bacterium]|nr:envelope stress response membrane protein PspC [Methylomirabilota bacterium]